MRARIAGLLAVLMLLTGCAREIPSTYIPPEPTAAPDSTLRADSFSEKPKVSAHTTPVRGKIWHCSR